jgi:hypothetical protein
MYCSLTFPGRKTSYYSETKARNGRSQRPVGWRGREGVLEEDLGYIFSEFGVYEKEKDRSAPQLAIVENEVMRLREIVKTGCVPESLIKPREDFRDKIIKSVKTIATPNIVSRTFFRELAYLCFI